MRYTHEELRKLGLGHLVPNDVNEKGEKKKKPKYNNTKTEAHGLKFDSKKEQARYEQLQLMQRLGLIRDLKHHQVFEIAPSVKFPSKKTESNARYYEADFVYFDVKSEKMIVEDVKSSSTAKNQLYLLKKHLMMAVHGIEIQEV